ncbi:hypothetical protein BH09BAC5_BH09BAC5_24650 [soil metagenome]
MGKNICKNVLRKSLHWNFLCRENQHRQFFEKIELLQLKLTGVILCFLSFNIVSEAQVDTTQLSLDAILVRMDTSYPALLQFNQKLNAISSRADGSRSWMPPTVSVGMNNFGYKPSMWGDQSPMNRAGIMISVEQMFPNPLKQDAKYNAIKSLSAPLQYDSAWLKNNLRSKAKYFYYEKYIAEKKLDVLTQSEELLDMLIGIAENRYAVNQSDLSTVFKAKARRAELTNMEAMLNARMDESDIGLNTLMNRDISTKFNIDKTIKPVNYIIPFAYDSLSNRSDIKAMDAEIFSMRQQQTYMKTETKPEFGLQVSHMQMLGMPSQFSVMGMMVFPIAPWSSGMYKSDIVAMDYEIKSMQLEKENMQLMARQMTGEKYTMLKYETIQLNNYDSLIIPAYQNNYDAAFLAYKNNTGNFFVLLDAWDMLLMKKMESLDQLNKVLLLQAQYEYELEK